MLQAKLVKEADVMLVPEPSDLLKESVDKSFSYDNPKSETSVVQNLPSTVHLTAKIKTSQTSQLPITTVDNRVPNSTSTSNLSTIPPTSCSTPKVSLTHPRTVTSVANSISTPLACYKPPSNPDQTSTPVPATPNSPWRGWTLPSQVPSHPKQISTPATQNSPWRGWAVPNQGVSLRPSLSGTSLQPHPRWGLIPDFPGPPPDAWIDQLGEYGVTSQPQLTTHYHCSFSAMERSLPKFDLRKFEGSPLDWPLWIGRLKSIVHDQPFLNDSQRLAYLQNTVTGAAESEIQLLGEDGAITY